MSIKTTLNLVQSRSLITKFKKLFNYFSIFTIVLGSTFGTTNSAYADDGDAIDIGTGADITKSSTADTGSNAITTGDFDLIIDAENDLTSDVAIGIDTIAAEDDTTADIFNILFTDVALTVDETVTSRDDGLTINVGNATLVSELILSGAATGAAANKLKINPLANATLTLNNTVTHSMNIDGAGTLKIGSGAVITNDEAIGGTTDLGILDVDGTLSSTSTIKGDVLDLDGTISAATSLIMDSTNALGGSITTTSVTTLTGATTLTADSSITTTDAKIDFGAAVNGAFGLTLNSGTAEVEFSSTVGNSAVVGAIGITGLMDLDGNIKNGTGAGAASLTVSDASTFDGDVFTSGIISLEQLITESDTTLNADDANITISAAADSDGNATDALTVDAGTGNITMSGAVGGSNTLGAIALTGAEVNVESTMALGGALTVTNTGDSELTGIVSGAQTVTKAGTGQLTIRAVNTFTGDLAVNAGSVVMLGNVDAAIDIGASGTVILDDTQVADSVVSATSNDGVVATGAVIKMPSNLKTTEKIVWSDGADNAAQIDALNAAILDNAMFDYVASDAGDDTHITATAKSAATTATELSVTNNQSIALAQALTSATNDTTADAAAEDAFANALNATGFSTNEDTTFAQQVAPQTDMISGSSVAAQAVTGSLQGIMSNRMATLRSGDAYFGTGVSAGGMSAQSGFIQVFGTVAEQDTTKVGSGNQAGYDSDTQGVAVGFDGVTDDGMTIGVSVATANTDVDGKGAGKSTNEIDTYSASLYMDRATENGYVEGSVTFGVNENSTSRKVNTGGLNRTYTGSYDSQSLSLNLTAGMPNEVAAGYLTPFGSVTASAMDTDAYTEKSTVADDALRLKVAQDDVSSLVGTVGIKYHGEMDNGGKPMISFAINREFGDSSIVSNNTYQGGGSIFKTSTSVEELSATLGLGYSYGSDATSIEFAYEADANDDDYLSHYGSIKIVGKF